MMRSGTFLLIAAACLYNRAAFAQAIDNTASFRMINADRYVRITYENDYFTSADYYYTQGIQLEFVSPAFQHFLLSKILVAPKNSTTRHYGIAVEHNGYTPTSISHDEILYGDRPFAAALMMRTFSASEDASRHWRITSSLSLGVIGPAAGGKEMQTTIHRWINDDAPKGWQYQIQNDFIVNYDLGIEKNFLQSGKHFLVNGMTRVRAGTLSTQLSSGLVLLFGKLNSAISKVFSRVEAPQRSESGPDLYFYAQPLINVVGYDATLQGGLFNRSSPYTISSDEIERITFQGNFGVVGHYRSLYLTYSQSILSKEFDTGMSHRWGGIRVGVNF